MAHVLLLDFEFFVINVSDFLHTHIITLQLHDETTFILTLHCKIYEISCTEIIDDCGIVQLNLSDLWKSISKLRQ
jgi:hypothetical protein